MENATADGVERQMFLVANGEVHDDDAVAASMRYVLLFVSARLGVGVAIPKETSATFEMIDLLSDAFVHGEVEIDDAVAAIHRWEAQLSVVFSRVGIFEGKTIPTVYTRLALPTAAVVDGDVITWARREVDQQTVFTFGMLGVVDYSCQKGVVVDQHIVETIV